MLEAGARCITQSGYHQANVDHIVRLAGFARGTFYKYFLLALSARCEVELSERIFAFSQIPADPSGGAARRIWLTDFLDFREVYVGVIRTWIDRTPSHPELDAARARITWYVHRCLEGLLATSSVNGVVSVRAAEILLIGIIERLPDSIGGNAHPARRRPLVELMASVIERGLLGLNVDGPLRSVSA
jgi:hypothetical protein